MMKKICFVSHSIYPMLFPSTVDFIGGAELQQIIIGETLQKIGYRVSYVTGVFDGKSKDETIREIEIYKTYAGNEGLPVIKFLYPRIAKLWKALERANADIYFQRCASFVTGVVAHFCKVKNRKFIYSASHDTNFIPGEIKVPYRRDVILYKYGLKNADKILVQSKQQKDLLLKNLNLNGEIFNNIFPQRTISRGNKAVLWVANIKTSKRPHLYLDIARKFPDIQFKMIGNMVKHDPGLFESIRDESEKIDNLDFLGFRSFKETETYFDKTGVFINTSTKEGFPNTFLQAWSRGIPVISFVDPDNAIQNNCLGKRINSLGEVDIELPKLLNSSEPQRIHIQDYFIKNHSPDFICQSLEKVF